MLNGFRSIFNGRNGFDALSGVILGAAVVLSIFYRFFPRATVLAILGIALVVWAFFRVMSTKVVLRRAENERFLDLVERVRHPGRPAVFTGYRYFTCPSCGQRVRVPKGRGRIAITCPSCNAGFIETT